MKWILLIAIGSLFIYWIGNDPTDGLHAYCKLVAPEDALGVAQEACFERQVAAWNERIRQNTAQQ